MCMLFGIVQDVQVIELRGDMCAPRVWCMMSVPGRVFGIEIASYYCVWCECNGSDVGDEVAWYGGGVIGRDIDVD